MKWNQLMIAVAAMGFLSTANAATKTMDIKNRMTVITNGVVSSHAETRGAAFQVDVLSDSGLVKPERVKDGRPFVAAEKDERYSVRLYNPLPVRVAVNLTVDGINSITGKPSGISDGSKWMIDPYSTVVIRGWQVNQNESRRFFFTDNHQSYAEWRGQQLGQNLAANCGVIGAAFFWNKRELQDYYDQHPTYVSMPYPVRCQAAGAVLGKMKMDQKLEAESSVDSAKKAGTGMGERESHETQLVDFRYDAGMYKLADAVVIYYDFETPVHPNPFPGLSYAPEMPN